jgi:hypothetical protein
MRNVPNKSKSYEKVKNQLAKRVQPFKSMADSKKATRYVRFPEFNPEDTGSKV